MNFASAAWADNILQQVDNRTRKYFSNFFNIIFYLLVQSVLLRIALRGPAMRLNGIGEVYFW